MPLPFLHLFQGYEGAAGIGLWDRFGQRCPGVLIRYHMRNYEWVTRCRKQLQAFGGYVPLKPVCILVDIGNETTGSPAQNDRYEEYKPETIPENESAYQVFLYHGSLPFSFVYEKTLYTVPPD